MNKQVETIRKEIERRMDDNLKAEEASKTNIFGVKAVEDNDILAFLDTLPEQPVEELEEEISRYLREECAGDDEPSVSDIARHFAEWGRKKVLQEIYDGKVKPVDKITAAWFDDEQNT